MSMREYREGASEVLSRSVGNALRFLSHTVVLFMSLLQKVQMSSGGAQADLSMLREDRCCRVVTAAMCRGSPWPKGCLTCQHFFGLDKKKANKSQIVINIGNNFELIIVIRW